MTWVLCSVGLFLLMLPILFLFSSGRPASPQPTGAASTVTQVPATSTNPPPGVIAHVDGSGRTISTERYVAPTTTPAPTTTTRTVRCDMITWHSRDDLAAALARAGRDGSQVMARAAADALTAGRATLLTNGDRAALIDGSAAPPAVKVEVLDGPYKGRTGWTIRAECLR